MEAVLYARAYRRQADTHDAALSGEGAEARPTVGCEHSSPCHQRVEDVVKRPRSEIKKKLVARSLAPVARNQDNVLVLGRRSRPVLGLRPRLLGDRPSRRAPFADLRMSLSSTSTIPASIDGRFVAGGREEPVTPVERCFKAQIGRSAALQADSIDERARSWALRPMISFQISRDLRFCRSETRRPENRFARPT